MSSASRVVSGAYRWRFIGALIARIANPGVSAFRRTTVDTAGRKWSQWGHRAVSSLSTGLTIFNNDVELVIFDIFDDQSCGLSTDLKLLLASAEHLTKQRGSSCCRIFADFLLLLA